MPDACAAVATNQPADATPFLSRAVRYASAPRMSELCQWLEERHQNSIAVSARMSGYNALVTP